MYDFTTLKPRRGIGAEKWLCLDHAGETDPDLAPLSVADMEFLVAPEIVSAIKEAADFGVYGYTVAEDRYKEAVCAWMDRRHGWAVEPQWLMQTFGVIPGVNLAVQALTKPGDGVIYQPPVYNQFREVVENTGRTSALNPLKWENGRYVMDLEGLEAQAARPGVKLMLLCSPHNPGGRVWEESELQAVADICARHGVTVFSDEIHADFAFPGHRHVPFATLDGPAAEGCIVGTSASKSFNLAGLATANLVVRSPALREALDGKVSGYTGYFNNYFGLAATRAAYESAEGWLDELLVQIKGNYEYCESFLTRAFPTVSVHPLEGTYLLWADLRKLGFSPDELEARMREELVYVTRGDAFGAEGAGFVRVNLACPRRCLEDAMGRLKRALGH